MTNGAHHVFTHRDFALTVMRAVRFFVLLSIAVMILAYLFFQASSDRAFDANLSFAVPATLYLSFIVGWAIAYSKYFRFPKNQRVLLLGVGLGALIVPAVAGPIRLYSGEISSFEQLLSVLPGYLLGGVLGAAIQLYALVLFFRYVFWGRLPF